MNIFNDYDINIDNINNELKDDLENNSALVKLNLDYLNSLGINNIKEIFKRYYPMFLMDNSNFMNVFNKYDKKDLLDKISKNMTIIEHL
jgi:hypothetical protein